ncbi:OmpH family outer membrane protein [Ostreiculturibacter nitratireducens]|uniref:OmpH family outer membrane protein n=1 Tax=Ostreiculturibacter nitratireducens TaxID=3075226 RepID=UPI0031B623EA
MRRSLTPVAFLAAAIFAAAIALPARAQEAPRIEVPSPILTLDQERLYAESLWGKRAAADLESASAALAMENRRIEAELTEEERALTDRRVSMQPEEFRAAADAFDAKVEEIRRVQDSKARELARLRDIERQNFYKAAFPVLGEVLRDRGAVAILDNRAIFIASDAIDVTDEMISRIDAALGEGKPPESLSGQDDATAPPSDAPATVPSDQ